MRILLINNVFGGGGGVERVFFIERKLLADSGHRVIDFSARGAADEPSAYQNYFVSGVNFQRRGHWLKKAARFFYSREVVCNLQKLINDTHPEVAHIHGIYDQLGPTVLRVLARNKIPTVFTAHAYKLICPNWRLWAHGAIDERCLQNPWHDFWNRSVQNSYIKSFVSVLSWQMQHRGQWFNYFTKIISPSQFLINKHVAAGWSAKKFAHLPNPILVPANVLTAPEKDYLLFVGRLAEEKGVQILLRAAKYFSEIPIIILGDGTFAANARAMAKKLKLENVVFVGARSAVETAVFIQQARAVVVPSLWYENDSYVVLEAQAQGKVVIASNIGGIPEQIISGKTGFLFNANNPLALASVVRQVWQMTSAARAEIGQQAKISLKLARNPEVYQEKLLQILANAIDKKA